MRSRRVLAAAAACIVAGTFAIIGAPTSALEVEGFTIDDKHLDVKKDYPPIPLQNPSAQVEDPTLDQCKSLPSDNAIPIIFAIKSTTPTKATFTVSFEQAGGANDLDVWFYDSEGNIISDAATGDEPEVFKLGGLPNGEYWLCVRNFSGASAYEVHVETTFLSLFEPPPPPPTARPPATPRVKTPLAPPAPTQTTEPTPAVTPEAVDTPGPDGATKEQKLVAVSGNKQAAPDDEGRSGLSVGLLALTGVILATGAGLVFVRIRRDTQL